MVFKRPERRFPESPELWVVLFVIAVIEFLQWLRMEQLITRYLGM